MKNSKKLGTRLVAIASREQGEDLRGYVVRYGRPEQLSQLEQFIRAGKRMEVLHLRLPMPTAEASKWLRTFLGEKPKSVQPVMGATAQTPDALLLADLSLPIEELDLSVVAYNRSKREGINTVGELRQRSEADLQLRRFKQQWIDEIKMKLTGLGFALRSDS